MKEILIDKEIGGWFGIQARDIKTQLDSVADGDDVKIVIDSPGGDFYEMVSIFNMIRSFTRDKTHKVETYIRGMAASAASMIALAAKAGNSENKITVEDNSIFMIHNCWTFEVGDHRVMEKTAKETLRIDELQRDIYERQTKKDRKKLSEMMDDDTWLYGQEIIDEGFADVMVSVPHDDTADGIEPAFDSMKSSALISAKIAFDNMQAKMKSGTKENANAFSTSRKEAVACLATLVPTQDTTTFVSSENNSKPDVSGNEETFMTLEELKAKEPELYAAAVKIGSDAERERVQSHLKMASDSGDINAAVEFINSGVNCSDNACVAKYHEVFTKTALKNARAQDTVPETVTPPSKDEAASAAVNAFLKETGLEA